MKHSSVYIKRILLLLPLIACSICFLPKPDFSGDSHFIPNSNYDVIAHRGASGLAPENTLEAIDSALSHKAKFIEVDIRQTMDSVLVLMHDKSINRTTNSVGKVHELLWSDLQEVKISGSNTEKSSSLKIPALQQILELMKNSDSQLVLEIKDPQLYPNIANSLIKLISSYRMEDRVVIISFDHEFLRAFKVKLPSIRIGGLFILKPSENAMIGFDFISVYSYTLRFFPSIIKLAHQNSIEVWAWTVNDAKQARNLLRKGLNGITTDYPNRF